MKTAYMITDKENDLTGIVSDVDEGNIQIEWENDKIVTYSNNELKALLETDNYSIEEVTIEEDDNEAQASIRAHTSTTPPGTEADGNPKTRLEMMLAIVGGLGQMDLQTLTRHFEEQQAQIGGAAEHAGLDGKAGGNQASIQMKPSAAMSEALLTLEKEEQDAIFGESTLTEDAKVKMTTLFETAVTARVLAETTKIQETLEAKYDTNIKEMSDELVEKMNDFFDYVVNEWVTENRVAIESSLRTQLTKEFVEQLKTLFVENYIEIPEEKVDVLEAVVFENEELKKQINDKINESLAKEKEVKALQKVVAVEQNCEGLTLIQKQKFRSLVAETEYTDVDSFNKKATLIKESFLKVPTKESNILREGIVEEVEANIVPSSDPAIARVAALLGNF
jgi:hypothetical protein